MCVSGILSLISIFYSRIVVFLWVLLARWMLDLLTVPNEQCSRTKEISHVEPYYKGVGMDT